MTNDESFRKLMTEHLAELQKSGNNVEIHLIHEDKSTDNSDVRKMWQSKKDAGTLAGCGLIGCMTMDEIDDMDEQITKAMSEWTRLAGLPSPRLNYYGVADENIFLKEKVKMLERRLKDLQPDGE